MIRKVTSAVMCTVLGANRVKTRRDISSTLAAKLCDAQGNENEAVDGCIELLEGERICGEVWRAKMPRREAVRGVVCVNGTCGRASNTPPIDRKTLMAVMSKIHCLLYDT